MTNATTELKPFTDKEVEEFYAKLTGQQNKAVRQMLDPKSDGATALAAEGMLIWYS